MASALLTDGEDIGCGVRSSRWEQLQSPANPGCWPGPTGWQWRIHNLSALQVCLWLKPEPGQFTVIPGAQCNLQIKGRCTFVATVEDSSISLAAKMLPCAWDQHMAGWSPQRCPERHFIATVWRPSEYKRGIRKGSGSGWRLMLLLHEEGGAAQLPDPSCPRHLSNHFDPTWFKS